MKRGILLPIASILLAAAILLGTDMALKDRAVENARTAHMEMLKTLMPGSDSFTREPYSGEDANIRSVHKGQTGYVIETVTYGYAGEITMYIGVRNDGTVVSLVVRDMEETWGLGAEALTDYEFLCRFLNTSGNVSIGTPGADAFSGATDTASDTEESVYVDGITGATVTSKAIARCVNSAAAYVTGADASSGATSWGG